MTPAVYAPSLLTYASRRVAALPPAPGDAHDQILELLLSPRRREGRPLHDPDARLDADRLEIGRERFAHRGVRRPRVEVAGVESVGIACLRHELLGQSRIAGGRVE